MLGFEYFLEIVVKPTSNELIARAYDDDDKDDDYEADEEDGQVNVHVTAFGDHAQNTGITAFFALCTTCCTRMWSKTRCHKHPSTATATGATALLLAVNHVVINPPPPPHPPPGTKAKRRLGARIATTTTTTTCYYSLPRGGSVAAAATWAR